MCVLGGIMLEPKNAYAIAIARACEAAGVPHWTPNMLRHTCATELRKKYGLEKSRAVLGHSKMETTEIYAEMDRDEARRIMREVG